MNLHQAFNLGIAITYFSIPAGLSRVVLQNWRVAPLLLRLILIAFALFIAACGTGHGLMAFYPHGEIVTASHGITLLVSAPVALAFPAIGERLRQLLLHNQRLASELDQQAALFHLFLDAHPKLFAWIKDERLAYTYCNQAMQQRFELKPGCYDQDWLPPDVAAVLNANDRAVLETGKTYEGIEVVPDPDGTQRSSLVYKFMLQVGTARLVGGTATDITEQERLRAEVELAFRELEEFTYAASHDLKTPLRGISGLLTLLERKLNAKLDDSERAILIQVRRDCDYANELINGILAYSKVGQAQTRRVPVDVDELLTQVCDRFAARFTELSATIQWHSEALPLLSADKTQLQQVFENLIDNALKYRSDAPPVIDIGLQHQRGEWIFAVTDNGLGVDPAFKDRLFVMFSRLHSRAEIEGTGIGLASVRKIAQRHGGNAWLESAGVGCGSTVYFSLRSL